MYVISLSNISIKANFKQMTRVELKLTNLLQYFECDYIVSMTSLYSQMSCDYIIVWQCLHIDVLDWEYWNYVNENVNMTINLWYVKLSDEWTLKIFPLHSNVMMLWTSSLAENVSCTVATFFNHHKLISLISKENLHTGNAT